MTSRLMLRPSWKNKPSNCEPKQCLPEIVSCWVFGHNRQKSNQHISTELPQQVPVPVLTWFLQETKRDIPRLGPDGGHDRVWGCNFPCTPAAWVAYFSYQDVWPSLG